MAVKRTHTHKLNKITYTALRRGTSKLLELVPNPFDDINKICSKQTALGRLRFSFVNVTISHKKYHIIYVKKLCPLMQNPIKVALSKFVQCYWCLHETNLLYSK